MPLKFQRCLLRKRKTGFVEIFRTTPVNTVCPNFYVLRHAAGCAFSPQCSYCYLKASFRHLSRPHVFTNVKSMLADIRRWIRKDGLESHVLNMGNLSDSLVFEAIRPIIPKLVKLFREAGKTAAGPIACCWSPRVGCGSAVISWLCRPAGMLLSPFPSTTRRPRANTSPARRR